MWIFVYKSRARTEGEGEEEDAPPLAPHQTKHAPEVKKIEEFKTKTETYINLGMILIRKPIFYFFFL